MEHYTIILHTRLNRKVFSAGNISRRLIEIIEDIPTEHTGIYLREVRVFPSALACDVSISDRVTIDTACYVLRKATSSKIREEFSELWSMPSLWSRKYSLSDKPVSDLTKEETTKFSR